MKKAYQGSCHCGAIQFRAQLDVAAGTTRCNCRFCRKARFWMAFAKASEFELLKGEAQVISGLKNKVQAVVAHIAPAGLIAEMHRGLAAPGSADK